MKTSAVSPRVNDGEEQEGDQDEKVRRSLGEEFFESHERTQRMLAARIAYLEAKIEAKRRAAGD
jgi:TATA-binding protein-associated factor Taf7